MAMAGVKQALARHPVSVLSHDDSAVGPELVGTNKFAVTWPTEPPPPVQTPLGHAVERPVVLSSSEGESDVSDREPSYSQPEFSDDYDTSPNHRRRFHHQPVSHTHDGNPDTPRLSRTFSMPLPSQLEHLQNPRRIEGVPLLTPTTPNSPYPPRLHEISVELADSVQMVVQTLLQISPAQILDPAKEQYAACSLSVPTSCMSAVLTTMKNLNFMSANMADLYVQGGCTNPLPGNDKPLSSSTPRTPFTLSDFDVGEMLQGVGDALSGCAAQIGVDLVLFHADVGLRHVAARGEECGLSNTLTYVLRQIMNTARQGDSIDVGLSVRSCPDSSSESPTADSARPQTNGASPTSNADDSQILCTFEITHRFKQSEAGGDVPTPTSIDPPSVRCRPSFDSLLLQRLFMRTGASFACDLPVRENLSGWTCELSFPLQCGSSAIINARTTPVLEVNSHLLSGTRITREPTLEELTQFSETLRGKKATLYAKESSSFAHHLTSYLTAWGMDVSHISSEPETDSNQGVNENASPSGNGQGATAPPYTKPRHWALTDHSLPQDSSSIPLNGISRTGPRPVAFIFIDDDVSILRERIQKYRAEQQPVPFAANSRSKRPSLAAHHRPKSSPQVVRALGYGSPSSSQTSANVVVHFSSLANYRAVKDLIQTDLALSAEAPFFKPPMDIMIIPKPAGPRRFLTALHTATTKPIVDPFFAPIATSPISPGLHSPPFFNFGQPTPKSPSSRPTNSPRTNSDRSAKSPRDGPGDSHALHPPSPLTITDTAEYFSDGSVKLGNSPASGLVISSPDGQPAGIVFQPRAKGAKATVPPLNSIEPQKPPFLIPTPDRLRSPGSRRPSSSEDKTPSQQPLSFAALHSTTVATSAVPSRQDSLPSPDGVTPTNNTAGKGKVRKPSALADEAVVPMPVPSSSRKGSPVDARRMASLPGSPNATEAPTNTPFRRQPRRAQDQKPFTPPAMPGKAGKGTADANIIPPISVLIVDDNPINQTILSTFMRKKKIKYDVAKNGEEAVQKWRSGGFHLILMDIQMPIMDGIQATKEIRHLEDLSAATYPPSTPQSDGSVRTPSDAASSESRTLASPYRSSVIIVALTASSLQSDRVAALAAGCNDFLTKPVSLQWLNNKIMEWGSIKALQMWADLRPEVAKTISTEQTAQAQVVARRLHVPEGRATPVNHSPSRSSSTGKTEGPTGGAPFVVSSTTLPPLQKLDVLRKLSVNSANTAINDGREQDDKYEGETVSSPVIQVAAIPDDPNKLPAPARYLARESGLTSSSPEATKHPENAAGGSSVSPSDSPSGSSDAHLEPDEIP
ncbi:hypothetical protein PAXRUDRAFT_821671 [Paxillus rubicundulus Ve08.2h10]|uniref:Response regulatory domain-containing protein n=1 Tax=Paxillus rubicundulus Ve08.2h10 TaxID=930991 RepID=A0A0D0DNJ8_9AGAM|nr:hypothetical protein PAXRUDRAFT_821671 [Paxillus rubicundulus Ve08.2h10]